MPQFIGTSMPRGYAGALTRGFFDNTTEVKTNDSTTPVKAFGVPVKYNAAGTGVVPCTATADASSTIGFSVRVFGMTVRDSDGADVQPQKLVTVLRRGYIAVKLASGTAQAGAAVYLDATGGISATSDSNTQVPGCTFMGAADPDGLVEIAFNI